MQRNKIYAMDKTITIPHSKGGVGKSTTVVNLAVFLVDLGHKVRIADCDPNKVSTFISKIRAANKELKNFEATPIDSVQALNAFCSTPFDGFTIIDPAGVDNALTRRSVELGSLCIVPLTTSITEIIGLKTFEAITKKLEVDPKNIKILINQTHPRATKFDYFKNQITTDFEFFNATLPVLGDFKRSLESGRGVVEIKKDGKLCSAGKRFTTFALEVMEVFDV